MKKYHLNGYKFDEAYITEEHFVARLKGKNVFYAFRITEDIRSHTFIEIKSMK